MIEAFTLARRESTWLPKTSELLAFYGRAAKRQREQQEALDKAAEREEQARLIEDKRLHPERYFSFSDLALGSNALAMDRPRTRPVDPRPSTPESKVTECPHCGGKIPGGVFDLNFLSAADLRSIADRRDRRAAERKAAGEIAMGAAAAPTKTKARKKGNA